MFWPSHHHTALGITKFIKSATKYFIGTLIMIQFFIFCQFLLLSFLMPIHQASYKIES